MATSANITIMRSLSWAAGGGPAFLFLRCESRCLFYPFLGVGERGRAGVLNEWDRLASGQGETLLALVLGILCFVTIFCLSQFRRSIFWLTSLSSVVCSMYTVPCILWPSAWWTYSTEIAYEKRDCLALRRAVCI